MNNKNDILNKASIETGLSMFALEAYSARYAACELIMKDVGEKLRQKLKAQGFGDIEWECLVHQARVCLEAAIRVLSDKTYLTDPFKKVTCGDLDKIIAMREEFERILLGKKGE